jgi:predicted dehydrogenase
LKKKILIIGYGSIGKKHLRILKKFKDISEIKVLSNHCNLNFILKKKLSKLLDYNPDYILICTETHKHFSDLKLIDRIYRKKIVLVEKPIFHKNQNYNFKNNTYFVGYNLRFHPVIKYIKSIVDRKKEFFFSARLDCSSYLPSWRKNIDYLKTYSSNRYKGGGVLLDLSHELDYLQYIFGPITKIDYARIKKISNLNTTSEDTSDLLGEINDINFSIHLSYFSRLQKREIFLNGNNCSILGNLINNSIEIIDKRKKVKKIIFSNNKDQTYIDQHINILSNKIINACSFNEGKKIISLVDLIKKNF